MTNLHLNEPESECVTLNLTVFALLSVLVFMALIYAILHCALMVLRNSGYDFVFRIRLSVGPELIRYSNITEEDSDINDEDENHDDAGEETIDHIKSEDEESTNNFIQEFMSSMVESSTRPVSVEETKIKETETQERKKFEEACKRSCTLATPTLPSSSEPSTQNPEVEDNTGGASKSYMLTGSSNLKFGDELPNINHTSSLQPTTGKVNVAEMMKALGLREYKN